MTPRNRSMRTSARRSLAVGHSRATNRCRTSTARIRWGRGRWPLRTTAATRAMVRWSDSRSPSRGPLRPRPPLLPSGIRNTGNPLEKGLPIAPGEFISVLGYNLGPQVPVNSGDTTWPTWIDGTVVRINGQDAPMKFISFYMIEVQVPVELDLSKNAKISVYRNGVATNEVEVPVAPTSPAVLTTNLSGTGQAAAVNSDGKQNGSANPAAKGSVITVLASGLGCDRPADRGRAACSTHACLEDCRSCHRHDWRRGCAGQASGTCPRKGLRLRGRHRGAGCRQDWRG